MWTTITRKQHSRTSARYVTDLTDEDWSVIEPYIPAERERGRPRSWPAREIVNGIFILRASGGMFLASASERFAAVANGLSVVCNLA